MTDGPGLRGLTRAAAIQYFQRSEADQFRVPAGGFRPVANIRMTVKSESTLITLRLTPAELRILLQLATDQLFRREFIDSRLPGCGSDGNELVLGKQLIQRLRQAAGIREPGKPASS